MLLLWEGDHWNQIAHSLSNTHSIVLTINIVSCSNSVIQVRDRVSQIINWGRSSSAKRREFSDSSALKCNSRNTSKLLMVNLLSCKKIGWVLRWSGSKTWKIVWMKKLLSLSVNLMLSTSGLSKMSTLSLTLINEQNPKTPLLKTATLKWTIWTN
jgi:hypothetical protein